MAGPGTSTYCAYCTAEFPNEAVDTVEQIQAHVYECVLHPMRKVEAENARLRADLASEQAARGQAEDRLKALQDLLSTATIWRGFKPTATIHQATDG